MNAKERVELAQELGRQGFAIRIDMWPLKATYYKKNGEAMPNLPADPVTMRRYINKGFSLVPPATPQPVVLPVETVKPHKIKRHRRKLNKGG